MSTSRSLVVSDREACSSWTWLASELVVLLPLVGFARFGVAAAVALLPTILARDCINPILSLTESGIGLYPNYINPILSIPFTSR